MRIVKSGKPATSPTCELARPGSRCFQKNLDANPEKSGFCGKSSTPAHVRFFPKPFISFASAQLRLRWHSPCARRLQQEVADRKPGGCERPRGHNPRAVVTGFKIYMRCARRTVPPGRKLANHKWLFIEELQRSLARSLASNAAVFINPVSTLQKSLAEVTRRSRYISPYRGACGTTVTSARIVCPAPIDMG